MCTCIAKVNERLQAHNGVLLTNWLSNPPRAMISVCKRRERAKQKPPLMEASHCPFCGKRYSKRRDALVKLAASVVK